MCLTGPHPNSHSSLKSLRVQSQKFSVSQQLSMMDGGQVQLRFLFLVILLGNIGSSVGPRLTDPFYSCTDRVGFPEGPFEGCQDPEERISTDVFDNGGVAYCIGLGGHSPGVHHFMANPDQFNRTGIAMYHATRNGFWTKFALNAKNSIAKEFTDIKVTAISVDGRQLEGWFHIKLTFPRMRTVEEVRGGKIDGPKEVAVYAYVIQIEDDTTYRATGEFTTELLHRCNGIDIKSTPTQIQIVPCHAVPECQVVVSNSVVYWREADTSTGQIIRTTDPTELRVNWKIPNNFGGGFANRFFIRADILTIEADRARNIFQTPTCMPPYVYFGENPTLTVCQNEPYGHTSYVTKIHLPPMTNRFFGPEPVSFSDDGAVNCDVPLPVFPDINDTAITPAVRAKGPIITQHPIRYEECQREYCDDSTIYCVSKLPPLDAQSLPISCRPKGADVVAGACTYGGGFYENRSALNLGLEGPRPLYLGRCKEDPRAFRQDEFWTKEEYPDLQPPPVTHRYYRLHRVNTTYPFIPRPVLPGTDPDNDFVAKLQTQEDYKEDLRYDTCNCYPHESTGGEFDPGQPVQSVRAPPPDYPDMGENVRKIVGSVSFRLSQGPENATDPDGGNGTGNANNTNSTVKSLNEEVLDQIQTSHEMHGVFMTFAFMFVVPVGIFIARYLKETFYGKTLLMYDLWYTLHIFSVMGTFALLFWGELMGIVAEIWRENVDHGLKPFVFHETIGTIVLVMFAFLAITGGIRSYGSRKALMLTIYIHTIVGYVFYYAGLVAMGSYCVEMGDSSKIGQGDPSFLALFVLIAWIVIDILFHVAMTLHAKRMDRKLNLLNRSVFPVMELLIDDMDAPGKPFRLIMFIMYAIIAFIMSLLFSIFIYWAEEQQSSSIDFSTKVDRTKKYH